MNYIPSARDQDKCDEAWAALELIAARVADIPSLPPLLPCEFGYFGRVERPGKPTIFEFKHLESRRWLQCTGDGRIARFVPPPGDEGEGRYVVSRRSLRTAVEWLRIDCYAGRLPRYEYCETCVGFLERRREGRALRAVRPETTPSSAFAL